jgi:hypothetical protein
MQTHQAANTLSVPSEARRSRASSFPALLLFGPTGTSVAARRARGSNAFPDGPCIPKPGTEIDDQSSKVANLKESQKYDKSSPCQVKESTKPISKDKS